MLGHKLDKRIVPYFVKYMIEKPNLFCCRRLTRLSMINDRMCDVAKSLIKTDTLFFSNSNQGVSVGTKTERIYIDSYNAFKLKMLSLHRLLKHRQELHIRIHIVANMPCEDELEFFTPEVAEGCGRMFLDFFPNAYFSVDFDVEGSPFIAKKILPMIDIIVPRLRKMRCTPCQMPWFEGITLDHLELSRKKRREGYCGLCISPVFLINARRITSHELLDFSKFLNDELRVQHNLQEFNCAIDLSKSEIIGHYYEVFGAIKASLPNLGLLNLVGCDDTVRWRDPKRRRDYEHDLHHKLQNGQMSEPYQQSISRLCWHIQQIVEYSHVKTNLSIQFQVRSDDYFKASQLLFKELLEDIHIDCENGHKGFDYPGTKKTLLFKGRNTEAIVAIEVLR